MGDFFNLGPQGQAGLVFLAALVFAASSAMFGA